MEWGTALGYGLGFFIFFVIARAINQYFYRKKFGNFSNYKDKNKDKDEVKFP